MYGQAWRALHTFAPLALCLIPSLILTPGIPAFRLLNLAQDKPSESLRRLPALSSAAILVTPVTLQRVSGSTSLPQSKSLVNLPTACFVRHDSPFEALLTPLPLRMLMPRCNYTCIHQVNLGFVILLVQPVYAFFSGTFSQQPANPVSLRLDTS